MIIVNWKAFEVSREMEIQRCILLFMIVIMIVMNILVMSGKDKVDTTGHLGGTIVGLLYGFAFFKRIRTDIGDKLRKIGKILLVLYFIVCILCFYLVRKT